MGDAVGEIGRALEQLLRLAASRKVHARQAQAAGVAISQPGAVLLRRLTDDGPLTMGDLARQTDMDAGATGRQVRQLEERGLVRRRAGPGDGRVVSVEATAEGRRARRRLSAVGDRHVADVLGRWTDADQAELGRLLSRFVDDLRSVNYRAVAEERVSS